MLQVWRTTEKITSQKYGIEVTDEDKLLEDIFCKKKTGGGQGGGHGPGQYEEARAGGLSGFIAKEMNILNYLVNIYTYL